MSDSGSVVSRIAAVLFFIAAASGVYGLMTHNRLAAAEKHVVSLQQERDAAKQDLAASEKVANDSTATIQALQTEVQSYKTRAETAEAALESATSKTKAKPARSRS
jgi:predicted  nucleic acid-binding Zn-ribbon protein